MFDPKGFFKSRAALRRELAALIALNKDLHQQVQDSLKAKTVTPAEVEEFTRIRQEHIRLTKEQAEIVMYLRGNFADEMARGDHAGMSLAQVVCMYMGRAKLMKGPVQ